MLKRLFEKTKALPFSKKRDAFQQQARMWLQRLLEHQILVFVIFGLLLLIGGGFAFYQYQQSQTEIKAQSQLYKTVAKWEALLQVSSEKELQITTQPGILMEEDYEELRSGYQRVIEEHKGTKGAILAALHLSHLQITQERLKEALASMQQVESVLNTEGLIDGMAWMALAHLYEGNDQCDRAVKIWDQVMTSPRLSFFHADALLKQGLCFEEMQNTNKAIENYQKLVDDHTQSPPGQMAQRLLHLITDVSQGSEDLQNQ